MQDPPIDDGLIIPEVGQWGKRKYHFLRRYLHMFSVGMKDKWPHRHYIDLFSGPGLARVRGTEEIVFTSAMLAAHAQAPFSGLHLCDLKGENCTALEARLVRTGCKGFYITTGDANTKIDQILKPIPTRGSLCLTLADPFGLHLDFATIARVANLRSDLIVLLADNMDALRNWAKYYLDNPESSLDRFMGEPGWRDLFQKAPSDKLAQAFRDAYISRLKTLGYAHFATERFQNSAGSDIYSLVFASRSSIGLKFWKEATKVDEGGQRSFDF